MRSYECPSGQTKSYPTPADPFLKRHALSANVQGYRGILTGWESRLAPGLSTLSPHRCYRRPYPRNNTLDKLVLQRYRGGIEALREFQRIFIVTVLRDQKTNQVRAAQKLGMHRNTLRRVIRKLELDIRLLRPSTRRPPLGERVVTVKNARAR